MQKKQTPQNMRRNLIPKKIVIRPVFKPYIKKCIKHIPKLYPKTNLYIIKKRKEEMRYYDYYNEYTLLERIMFDLRKPITSSKKKKNKQLLKYRKKLIKAPEKLITQNKKLPLSANKSSLITVPYIPFNAFNKELSDSVPGADNLWFWRMFQWWYTPPIPDNVIVINSRFYRLPPFNRHRIYTYKKELIHYLRKNRTVWDLVKRKQQQKPNPSAKSLYAFFKLNCIYI